MFRNMWRRKIDRYLQTALLVELNILLVVICASDLHVCTQPTLITK